MMWSANARVFTCPSSPWQRKALGTRLAMETSPLYFVFSLGPRSLQWHLFPSSSMNDEYKYKYTVTYHYSERVRSTCNGGYGSGRATFCAHIWFSVCFIDNKVIIKVTSHLRRPKNRFFFNLTKFKSVILSSIYKRKILKISKSGRII